MRANRLLARPFLDLSALLLAGGERGLLSVAFDPGYARNGFFYVYFTDRRGDIVISRYRMSATDPDLADPGSALTILTIARNPLYGNHNGGLLGKLLRLDVRDAGPGRPYTVPADNPFLARGLMRVKEDG